MTLASKNFLNGLNHFFWITGAKYKKIDIFENFKRKLKNKTISDLLPKGKADSMGFSSGRAVADELYRMTGFIPYLGDRHTCEYFSWFITNKKNMRKYKIKRTSIEERVKGFNERANSLKKNIKGKISGHYFKRSRETAADIIDAHFYHHKFL